MEKDLESQLDKGPPQEEAAVQAEAELTVEEKLSEELRQQQEETRKNYDQYLRALAEVENIKKRAAREREEYLKYANVSMIKKLLPIIDDLHRAIGVARTTHDLDAISKGVEMTVRSLDELLKGEGVVAIESVGKPFDPQYHQALTVEPSDEHPENTVIEQLQTGYIMHDRVIRPSLVKVSS
ncbi:MAG: nucleotide exchange factor GrpE [Syntrophomonadaceae bacterium]|nr:nucleotide exchange factor GrpE [Syntrophomonadaceae bacterium]